MAAELLTGIGIFKSMMDIAKGLKDIHDATIRNAAVVELQEKILSAQQSQSLLLERIGALEAEVAAGEKWDAQKERYELQVISNGVRAYVLKSNADPAEIPHEACPNCYTDRRISVLQPETRAGRRKFLACHRCGLGLNTSGGIDPEPPRVIRRDPARRY